MKKFLLVLCLCAAVVACKKEEAAPADAAAPAADAAAAPAEAAPAADATAPVAADAAAAAAPDAAAAAPAAGALPAACEEYFKRAEACFNKAGANGAALKAAFDSSREQMLKVPADQMEMGCKAASDSFSQTATMLKCE